ncbi:MAG: hypothetical protein PHG05_02070 [Candidatus Nanoarchaeia archaeon]|nr:hypothetical protein [Candidatus Nanoarchaeia archaeon]
METRLYSDPNKLLDEIPLEGFDFPYQIVLGNKSYSNHHNQAFNIQILLEVYKKIDQKITLIQKCDTNLSCGYRDSDYQAYKDGKPIQDLIQRIENEFDQGLPRPLHKGNQVQYILKGRKDLHIRSTAPGDQVPLI